VNSLLYKVDFTNSLDAIQMHNYYQLLFPYHDISQKVKRLFTFISQQQREKTMDEHVKILDDFVYEIIKKRRLKQAENRVNALDESHKTDLLLRFMTAKNANGEYYTDQDLRDCMLNLVVAVRDTSAETTSWFLYNMMKYPEIQAKLLEEIDDFITEGMEENSADLYQAIQKMKYAHAV
jgi:cytochrome P450